jgi:hypothetical protein
MLATMGSGVDLPHEIACSTTSPSDGRGRGRLLVGSFSSEREGERETSVIRRLAFAFGKYNRRRKARFALKISDRFAVRSVLLVGVSKEPNPPNKLMNLVERRIADAVPFTVASGLSSNQVWDWYVVADGRALPFSDGAFDLVYANAVVEHVGDESDQRRFIGELARVGRIFIATTPNRWFPVEAHYHTLFTHWGSRWAPRESVSRLLGIRSFRSLLPFGKVRGWPVISPTLTAIGVRPQYYNRSCCSPVPVARSHKRRSRRAY